MFASCIYSGNQASENECEECETAVAEIKITSENIVGDYLCTVAEKASIESLHLEGAGPPKAFIDDTLPTRFKIRISLNKSTEHEFRLIELPYYHADRDPTEWHTSNSILHSTYIGNEGSFLSTEKNAEAFFVFEKTVHISDDGAYQFYHAGFEWRGSEDTNLSARWGRCKQI